MVKLRHDTTGSSHPAGSIGRLQVSIVSAVFNGAAGAGPLSKDTTGIVGLIAINGTVVQAVLNGPAIAGGIILISDNASCKTVGRII